MIRTREIEGDLEQNEIKKENYATGDYKNYNEVISYSRRFFLKDYVFFLEANGDQIQIKKGNRESFKKNDKNERKRRRFRGEENIERKTPQLVTIKTINTEKSSSRRVLLKD